MKKTYSIHISGYIFIIEEDAYDTLNSYLMTLGEICNRAGEKETAADIEQRIAEIFEEKRTVEGRSVISLVDVEEVITRMGAPEEIVDDVELPPTPGGETPPPPHAPIGQVPVRKRLYRDLDNKVLGGVCSGIGWYLNIDPVWVRIIAVLLAFLSGSTLVLIYIILWIAIPGARTPYERMQMMGMDSSMRNVGRVVTGGNFSPRNASANQSGNASHSYRQPTQTSDTLSNIGNVIIMILTALGLVMVGSLLLALSLAFVGCIIALAVSPVDHSSDMAQARLIMGCVVGGTLVVGVPLFLLFRYLVGVLVNRHFAPFTPQQRLFFLIAWLLGAAACIVCGILL